MESIHGAPRALRDVVTVGEVISRGGFGVVRNGCFKEGSMLPLAIKSIALPPGSVTLQHVLSECHVHQRLHHPNILRLHGWHEESVPRLGDLHIFLELAKGPGLQQLLDIRGAFR